MIMLTCLLHVLSEKVKSTANKNVFLPFQLKICGIFFLCKEKHIMSFATLFITGCFDE